MREMRIDRTAYDFGVEFLEVGEFLVEGYELSWADESASYNNDNSIIW